MSELLPLRFLSNMSIYDVNIGGDTVITRVADRIAIMKLGISELKAELKSSDSIVGIDIINDDAGNISGADLLLLYIKKRCLIIQYNRMMSLERQIIPDSLLQFLRDNNITFVGPGTIKGKSLPYIADILFKSVVNFTFETVVDIGYLAAKALKKPKLLTSTLEEVVVEAGVDIKKPIPCSGAMRKNWASSSVLSDEEVKYAMYQVYSCYQIACKLIHVSSAGMAGSSNIPTENKKKG